MSKHIKVIDNFFDRANELRGFFDSCFHNPKEATEARFVWDNWYVKDKYHLVRTPAYHYFPEELYNDFHQTLVTWGRENLGCFDISPPWLSYYTDGHFQNWHADVPHGPWAFVFSITNWDERKFEGGETQLIKPNILNFWSNFDSSIGLEQEHIIDLIPSQFNQLTLFDPRLPHGVREVKGVKDPLEARIVIHGWFTEPRPFIKNFDDEDSLIENLNGVVTNTFDDIEELPDVTGVVVYKMIVSPEGAVEHLSTPTNNLISRQNIPGDIEILLDDLSNSFKNAKFLANDRAYQITLPLIFEATPE